MFLVSGELGDSDDDDDDDYVAPSFTLRPIGLKSSTKPGWKQERLRCSEMLGIVDLFEDGDRKIKSFNMWSHLKDLKTPLKADANNVGRGIRKYQCNHLTSGP